MSNDSDYYRERARRERELANASSDARAAVAHATMADVYEAMVANDQRPTASILTPDFQKRRVGGREKAVRANAMENDA